MWRRSASASDPIRRFCNYHAPGEVRVFSIPVSGVKRWDNEAVVYDVAVAGDRILRHYSFGNRWFEVNCSLDRKGRFVTEHGPIDWTFNCDISTPHVIVGPDLFNMDLWVDVLVGPDGRTHQVIDEEDFVYAVSQGWPTDGEVVGARSGLADLLGIIHAEGLVSFLEHICPFDSVADVDPQPPMDRRPVTVFPVFDRNRRPLLFGR